MAFFVLKIFLGIFGKSVGKWQGDGLIFIASSLYINNVGHTNEDESTLKILGRVNTMVPHYLTNHIM